MGARGKRWRPDGTPGGGFRFPGGNPWATIGGRLRVPWAISGLVGGGAKRNKPVTILGDSMEWRVVRWGRPLVLPGETTGTRCVSCCQDRPGSHRGPSSWVPGLGSSAIPKPRASLRPLKTTQSRLRGGRARQSPAPQHPMTSCMGELKSRLAARAVGRCTEARPWSTKQVADSGCVRSPSKPLARPMHTA